MKLIFQSLLCAAVLLGAYHLLLKRLPSRLTNGGRAGSQNEINMMTAERFYYGSANPRIVLAGSSIGQRLRGLPQGWDNLSFAGGSAFTAMEIILRSDKHPRYVLIETNVLTVDADQRMLDSLFYPGISQLRRKMPELMEKNKPHDVLLRMIDPGAATPPPSASPPARAPASAPAADSGFDADEIKPADPLYVELRDRRLKLLADPLTEDQLQAVEKHLRQDVSRLQARGTQVIFFEAPEWAAAMDQPLPASLRQRLHQAFPQPQYHWIPPVDARDYRTTDFVHLTANSAQRYTRVLGEYVQSIQTAPPASAAPPVSTTTTRPTAALADP